MSDKFLHHIKRHNAVITSLIVFIIYLTTLAPSVLHIDSGELAAVQATLGIAHPTGYPLFTLIGYLFLQIPFNFSQIISANILNAIWCSSGLYLFIKAVQTTLEHIPSTIQSRKSQHNISTIDNPVIQVIVPSLISGLTLAFSKTYWMQSTSVEVYSLQIFLFALIIFTVVKAYYAERKRVLNWLWVGIAFALGFSNHMTTILVLPFAAFFFFAKEKISLQSIKTIIIVSIISIPLVILLYLYLPVRASANPEINWGNPVNFENFWRHLTGQQYQVWLFSSLDSAKKQLSYFINNLPSEFAYLPLFVITLGFINTLKRNKIIFSCIGSTFVIATLYSINYDIVDIDSYFLLSYFMLTFFCAFGYRKIFGYLFKKLNKYSYMFGISILFSIIPLIINYTQIDQSDKYIFEDYTKAILNSVDSNSVIFSYQWDYFISPSYYFQYVENYRRDVAVIDKELLRRSWYYNQIRRNYPKVVDEIENDINSFISSVKPFERNEKYNPVAIENNYRNLMTNLTATNVEKSGFYIGIELLQNEIQQGEYSLPAGYTLVPDLLLFRVVKGKEYIPAKDPNFILRFPKRKDKYVDFIEKTVGIMLISRAAYEMQFGKKEKAKIYLNKILEDLNNVVIPNDLYQQVFK